MRPLALLLALVCSVAVGAPPAVDIPPEVKPAGQYVTLVPKTDAAAITYIGLSGVEPIPAAVLKDGRMFLLDTRGLAAGRYKFVAVASLDDEHARVDFAVIVGNPPPQPEPPGPGPEPDPPKPPVVDVPDELVPAVAALAAFPKQRAELGKFYRDFAKVVESSNLTTTGQFRTAHANALKTFVAATGYTAPKVGTHIDAYLAECIGGLEDKPLNAELKARLAAALKTIGEVMQ